ncbi:MAG: hypothetical protein R3E54_04110 [Halioglobus sp.]
MNISVYLVSVLVLAAAVAAGYVIRSQFIRAMEMKPRPAPAPARSAARAPVPPRDPYRAVSVKPGTPACREAKVLAQRRFLVAGDAIPRLPLDGCDCAQCTCTYSKHPDRRRRHEERRALGGISPSILEQRGLSERRRGRDRRAGERPAW